MALAAEIAGVKLREGVEVPDDNRTLPRLNRSLRWSRFSPRACSGDRGVPTTMPLCVMLSSSAAGASPKSVIFTRNFPLTPDPSPPRGEGSRNSRPPAASPSAI